MGCTIASYRGFIMAQSTVIRAIIARGGSASISGCVYDVSEKEYRTVSCSGLNESEARAKMAYYSDGNGFECQRVIIKEV